MCRISGRESLTATGPPSSCERGDGVVLAGDDAAVDDRDAGGAEQRPWPRARRASGRRRSRGGSAATGRRRGGGHLAQAAGVGAAGLQGGGAGEAGAQAGDGGDAGLGEAPGGRVVEQLGQRGGDHDRDRARVGAVEDAVLDRLPALADAPSRPGGWS